MSKKIEIDDLAEMCQECDEPDCDCPLIDMLDLKNPIIEIRGNLARRK